MPNVILSSKVRLLCALFFALFVTLVATPLVLKYTSASAASRGTDGPANIPPLTPTSAPASASVSKPAFVSALAPMPARWLSNAPHTSAPATTTVLDTPDCGPDWTVVPSPNVTADFERLYGIDTLSSNDVWAVGSYSAAFVNRTLIEHWNGTSWNVIPSPNVYPGHNILWGVAAVSSNDVWAVGDYEDSSSVHRTLTMHWNGSIWSVVPSPNTGPYGNFLYAATAISASDIWAVGSYGSASGQAQQTLTLHWNDSSWSVITNPGPIASALLGVAAVSSNDVWAVGGQYVNSSYMTLTMHWNGSAWSVITSPSVGTGYNILYAATAISPSDIWAVGIFRNGSNSDRTQVIHWNGTAWSVVPSPNPGAHQSDLRGVAAASSSDVWAVGYYDDANFAAYTLIEHWNGSTWSVVPSPNVGSFASFLYAASAISATQVWAAGYYASTIDKTLVEQYDFCDSTPTPTLTPTPQPPRCPSERFTDVCPGDPFYPYIQPLADDGILSGYNSAPPCRNYLWIPCFNPNNTASRGQISKVVSMAAGFNEPVSGRHFQDVPPGSTFYTYTTRLASRDIISGYPCGNLGEPCVPPDNLPYFRVNREVTRGQISKMVSLAFNWIEPIIDQQFEDVSPGSTFYDYIGRLYNRSIINGYPCGGANEPCVPPGNLPYFRPNNNVTRGQTAKIVQLARTQPTPTPTSTPSGATPTPTSTPTNPDCQGIPPSQDMEISPGNCEPAGTTFTFVGSGFQPNELIYVYMTAPDSSVFGAPFQIQADDNGIAPGVTFHTTSSFPTGVWYLTMEGVTSQHQAIGYFRLLSP